MNQGLSVKTSAKRKLSFLAGCIVNEKVYFSAWHDRGFYRQDFQTGQCELLKTFDKEEKNKFLYSQVVYYKNTMWMIPGYGSYLVRIDLETLEMTYISLPEKGKEICDSDGKCFGKFKCCYQEGKTEFWLIPVGYNLFLKIDMITGNISEFSELNKNIIFENGTINFGDACFVKDEIWFCPREGNKLVIFDTVTYQFRILEWKYSEEKYFIIKNYENWVIFLAQSMDQDILLINKDTYEEKRIALNVKWETEDKLMYLVADIIDHYIFLAPFFAHEFVAVDIESGEIEVETKLHEYVKSNSWGQERYQASIKYGEKMVYTSDVKNMPLMIYDNKENEVSYVDIAMNCEDYRKFLMGLSKKDKQELKKWLNTENGNVFLEEGLPSTIFCTNLALLKDKAIYDLDIKKSIGKDIFLNIKNEREL